MTATLSRCSHRFDLEPSCGATPQPGHALLFAARDGLAQRRRAAASAMVAPMLPKLIATQAVHAPPRGTPESQAPGPGN